MTRKPLYLLAAFLFASLAPLPSRADIPPTPEQKKKIAETPRISPNGELVPLGDRPFSRTVGGAKAKVVIPKAIFEELAAAVAAKGKSESAPTAKEGSIPPIALVFAGLAMSGAFLYLATKAPRYRWVTAAAAAMLAGGSLFFWTRDVEANAGPPRPRPVEGQIIIEVPAEGANVSIYLPEATTKSDEPETKSK